MDWTLWAAIVAMFAMWRIEAHLLTARIEKVEAALFHVERG